MKISDMEIWCAILTHKNSSLQKFNPQNIVTKKICAFTVMYNLVLHATEKIH